MGCGENAQDLLVIFRSKLLLYGLWRGFTEIIFKIIMWFQKSKLKRWLRIFQHEGNKKRKNHQRTYRKYLFNIIGLQVEYSSRDPIPLLQFTEIEGFNLLNLITKIAGNPVYWYRSFKLSP